MLCDKVADTGKASERGAAEEKPVKETNNSEEPEEIARTSSDNSCDTFSDPPKQNMGEKEASIAEEESPLCTLLDRDTPTSVTTDEAAGSKAKATGEAAADKDDDILDGDKGATDVLF